MPEIKSEHTCTYFVCMPQLKVCSRLQGALDEEKCTQEELRQHIAATDAERRALTARVASLVSELDESRQETNELGARVAIQSAALQSKVGC